MLSYLKRTKAQVNETALNIAMAIVPGSNAIMDQKDAHTASLGLMGRSFFLSGTAIVTATRDLLTAKRRLPIQAPIIVKESPTLTASPDSDSARSTSDSARSTSDLPSTLPLDSDLARPTSIIPETVPTVPAKKKRKTEEVAQLWNNYEPRFKRSKPSK